MPTILLLFYLLLPPTTTHICALWLSQPPTAEDLAAACPEGIDLEHLTVQFVNIGDGKIYCEKNATAIWAIDQACHFGETTLDNYRMEIVRKDAEMLACSIQTTHQRPKRSEIAAACSESALYAYDNGTARLKLIGEVQPPESEQRTVEIPTPQAGPGLFDQVNSVDELRTDERLSWLAGRLIWHGIVKADCDGSGLDPVTLAANECGLESAAVDVTEWQNRFDSDIYAAALAEGVPARLLKRIIRYESQFWPGWQSAPAGETGMAQITPNGADTYLRWYQPDYGFMTIKEQERAQAEFLNTLRCELCTLEEAAQKESQNILIYARILRAYRGASTDWGAALVLWNGQDYANQVES
jgi:hypothetical protein